MEKKEFLWYMLLCSVLLGLTGCTSATGTLGKKQVNTIDMVISELTGSGYGVESEAAEDQALWGDAYRLTLDKDQDKQIVVYVYESEDEAKREADGVDKAGTTILFTAGDEVISKKIDWTGVPYFYQKDNLIIQYVGEDETILNTLEETCGTPFAGGDYFTGVKRE